MRYVAFFTTAQEGGKHALNVSVLAGRSVGGWVYGQVWVDE